MKKPEPKPKQNRIERTAMNTLDRFVMMVSAEVRGLLVGYHANRKDEIIVPYLNGSHFILAMIRYEPRDFIVSIRFKWPYLRLETSHLLSASMYKSFSQEEMNHMMNLVINENEHQIERFRQAPA